VDDTRARVQLVFVLDTGSAHVPGFLVQYIIARKAGCLERLVEVIQRQRDRAKAAQQRP
jgi:hypothetical protein